MYHYQEYNPDILLTPWIKNYWSADGFWESKVTPILFSHLTERRDSIYQSLRDNNNFILK